MNLTPLGIFHTVISVLAVVLAFVALSKDKGISPRTRIGQTYLLSLLTTTLTGFPIFRHGKAGAPHVLGVITLVVLALAVAAQKRWFGRASVYVETLSYSSTVLLLMVPAVTETLTRLPVDAPLAASPESPIVQSLILLCLGLFLAGAALQVRSLRSRSRGSSPRL